MPRPLTNTMPQSANGVQIYPYQYFGMVGVSPTVQQSSFIHVSALVNTLRISGYQAEADTLEALLRAQESMDFKAKIQEILSSIDPKILEKNNLAVQNNGYSLFNSDSSKKLSEVLISKTIDKPEMPDAQVQRAVNILRKDGFENPEKILIASDFNLEIIQYAKQLSKNKRPTADLILNLVWLDARGYLDLALRLIDEYNVPVKFIKNVVSYLNIYYPENKVEIEKFVLSALRDTNIKERYWWKCFVFMLTYKYKKPIEVCADYFRKAKKMGFGKWNLLYAYEIMMESGDEGAKILSSIRRSVSLKEGENIEVGSIKHFPCGLTLNQALLYYTHVTKYSVPSEIIYALGFNKSAIDDYWGNKRDKVSNIGSYGIKIVELSEEYGLHPRHVRDIGPNNLSFLSQSDLPKEAWIHLSLEELKNIKVCLKTLKQWQKKGWSWREYLVLGSFDKVENSGFNFEKIDPGKFRKLHVDLSKMSDKRLFELKEFINKNSSVSFEAVFIEFVASPNYFNKSFESHGLLSFCHSRKSENGYDLKVIVFENNDGYKGALFQQRFFATVDFFEIDAETLFITNIQSDDFRKLDKDEKEKYHEWESHILSLIEELARSLGKKKIVIKTPYGIMSNAGVLNSASSKNILDVYFDKPFENGYNPVFFGKNHSVYEFDNNLDQSLRSSRFYMLKELE